MAISNVQETTFEARTYLVLRKVIEISKIADHQMWEAGFGKVFGYLQAHEIPPAGPAAALYFHWDEAAGQAELGIAAEVQGAFSVEDPELSLVEVAESKASHLSISGDYSQLPQAHGQIMAYLAENSLAPTLTVEEYTAMGMDDSDTAGRETNLYYLHD